MNKVALLCGVMLLFAGVVSAQDYPKVEASAGYSYLNVTEDALSHVAWTGNGNGGSASASFNPNNWLGLVADVGGYTGGKGKCDICGLDGTIFTYLFGPKVAFRTRKLTPFAQALFGGAHITSHSYIYDVYTDPLLSTPTPNSGSEDAFATALGGGVDWNATSHVGVRVAQVEWLMTRFRDGYTGGQNNVRISAGVVFRF